LDEYLADHAKPLHTSTPNLLPAQHAPWDRSRLSEAVLLDLGMI